MNKTIDDLRDMFAAAALTGMVTTAQDADISTRTPMVRACYAWADEMLEARKYSYPVQDKRPPK